MIFRRMSRIISNNNYYQTRTPLLRFNQSPFVRRQPQIYSHFSSISNTTDTKDPLDNSKTTVIIGTGWAGYKALVEAKKMLKKSKESHKVVVISERNHFLYTPLLASTTVGTLEFRSIIETVRAGKHEFRDEEDFHLASVKSIDSANKSISVNSVLDTSRTYNIPYDSLVIACGARPNSFGVPGVEEHAFFLKEIWDARAIRTKILENLELASQPGRTSEEKRQLLHFLVVGGGPTGVEFCAELYDFIEQDLTRIFPKSAKYLKVSLVESREILGMFDQSLRDFANRKITSRPRMEIIKQNCAEIKADCVVLGDKTVAPCGMVVWSAGVGPSPLTKSLPFAKAPNGCLLTNEYCQVVEDSSIVVSSVYAIGDCAEIDRYPLPATAQVAQSQAEYLCHTLFSNNKREPYSFTSKGLMTYVGGYQGLLEVKKTKLSGWKSWFAWRSTYLTKLGSWRLRMQVPIDWLKTIIVGRDVSRF